MMSDFLGFGCDMIWLVMHCGCILFARSWQDELVHTDIAKLSKAKISASALTDAAAARAWALSLLDGMVNADAETMQASSHKFNNSP